MHSPEINITDASCSQNLLGQTAGALAWGIFFILMPLEFLFFGAIIWIPLLLHRERLREKRYGTWPGFYLRAAILATVVIAAFLAPTKHEDRRVGPLSSTRVFLDELDIAEVVLLLDVAHQGVKISLPSTNPTLREIEQAIKQQTELNARIDRSSSLYNILLGGFGYVIVGETM